MHRLIALALLILSAFAIAPDAGAEPGDIDAATRGVVRIVIIGRDGEEIFPISHGTGFAVGNERIVTNAHVVAQAAEDDRLTIGIVPADGDRAVYARIVTVSAKNDLALLATTEALNLPALTIAGNPEATGQVTAIGYPRNVDLAQGLALNDMLRAQPPVTATGFLSGRRPSRDFDTLLHTAPIAAGNSGGPLVDTCGRVIGVNSFGAESAGSDAEFFFAVSTRELLPFLRANGVSPAINSGECRSLEAIDAEEQARRDAEQAAAEERAAVEAEALAARTEELRRTIGYEVMDERANRMMLAFVLLLIATAAGAVAWQAHREDEMRTRAIAGSIALVALVIALVVWVTRPPFRDVDSRLQDRLAEEMGDAEDSGTIAAATPGAGSYSCVLDAERSRVTGDPAEDVSITWSESGCINGRTQYGLSDGRWTRIFVPSSDAAVSVNSFDPGARQLVMERYLLDRAAMTEARTARGRYSAPSCEAGDEAARTLGTDQRAVAMSLPDRPNERLVYSCTVTEGGE